ncbi:protein of unknown function [Candidatus Bipolaricaulis anaerobius]|uniref:Uncharacterized protein n=1 Tax=Candidatus Bipolaricaulis anaerobius TaxID=2026885 RepID=A0A2X3MM50_9BACT|nr:protein of unknown function [Candidatus Bipolaricaulis anaerobius]
MNSTLPVHPVCACWGGGRFNGGTSVGQAASWEEATVRSRKEEARGTKRNIGLLIGIMTLLMGTPSGTQSGGTVDALAQQTPADAGSRWRCSKTAPSSRGSWPPRCGSMARARGPWSGSTPP